MHPGGSAASLTDDPCAAWDMAWWLPGQQMHDETRVACRAYSASLCPVTGKQSVCLAYPVCLLLHSHQRCSMLSTHHCCHAAFLLAQLVSATASVSPPGSKSRCCLQAQAQPPAQLQQQGTEEASESRSALSGSATSSEPEDSPRQVLRLREKLQAARDDVARRQLALQAAQQQQDELQERSAATQVLP